MKKHVILLTMYLLILGCENDKEIFRGTACIDMPLIGYPVNQEIQFTNCSENASHFLWNFGDGTISRLKNPTHTYMEAKSYRVILIAQNSEVKDYNGDDVYDELDQIVGKSDVTQIDIVITDEKKR